MKNGVMEYFSRLKCGRRCSARKSAEGTAALHDAGARFARPLHIGEAFWSAPVFLALWFDAVRSSQSRSWTKLPLRKLEIRCPQPFSRSARFLRATASPNIFVTNYALRVMGLEAEGAGGQPCGIITRLRYPLVPCNSEYLTIDLHRDLPAWTMIPRSTTCCPGWDLAILTRHKGCRSFSSRVGVIDLTLKPNFGKPFS